MSLARKISTMTLGLLILLQPTWGFANQNDTYRAFGDNAHPPLVFVNEMGQQDGYDVDFIHLLENEGAGTFDIMLLDWDNAKANVAQGKGDILIGVVNTPEREKFFDFTQPYLETRLVIFTTRSNFLIRSANDLVNRRVGVQRGDFGEDFLKSHLPSLHLHRYTNQKDALKALVEGELDAVVGSYFIGMYWINQHNLYSNIKVVGTPLAVNAYSLGVPKGDTALLSSLNTGIDRLKKTGKLKQLQDKWFGENYFLREIFGNPRLMEFITWGVFGAIVLIGTVVLFVYSLRRKVEVATSRLREANQELVHAYDVTIRAFFSALEKRESGTANHSLAVNNIALEIGREMKLSENELLYLHWGTLLHDIGKLAISDDILLKEGNLTAEEYEKIKQHPTIGYQILQGAEYLREAARIALYHQERFDGKGYPNGLKGDGIPLLARICSVADAFEAMISDRPYRKGRPYEEAMAELVRNSGSQFDPQVVRAFLQINHSAQESVALYEKFDREIEGV